MNGCPARFRRRVSPFFTQKTIQLFGREMVFLAGMANAETNGFFKGGCVLIVMAFRGHNRFCNP